MHSSRTRLHFRLSSALLLACPSSATRYFIKMNKKVSCLIVAKCFALKICETVIFPLVKPLGERIVQILDGSTSNQEKLPAERVKQEIIVGYSGSALVPYINVNLNTVDYLVNLRELLSAS